MALQLPAHQQATSGEDFVATQGSVTLSAEARQANVHIVIKQVSQITEKESNSDCRTREQDVKNITWNRSGGPGNGENGTFGVFTLCQENDRKKTGKRRGKKKVIFFTVGSFFCEAVSCKHLMKNMMKTTGISHSDSKVHKTQDTQILIRRWLFCILYFILFYFIFYNCHGKHIIVGCLFSWHPSV